MSSATASHTVLVGEKAMHPDNYYTGTWYWDDPYFTGGSGSTARKGLEIVADPDTGNFRFRENWGSAHPRGANFVFGDNSVRPLSYGLRSDIVLALLTPDGG